MSVELKISIPDLEKVQGYFSRMPAKVAANLDKAIKTSGLLVEQSAKNELGGGKGGWDTGRLVNSIKAEFGILTTTIAPHVNYAVYVHEGTRPHWVPLAAIAPWAHRHGIEPFLVQRAIAKKGTKANPFMARAVATAQSGVNKIFLDAIERIVKA